MVKSEHRMEKEKTVVGKKAGKAEADAEKYKSRYEETKKKLTEQLAKCNQIVFSLIFEYYKTIFYNKQLTKSPNYKWDQV